MGFFFRDSLKLGKFFKLNFSKSGIGLSGGVKGFRISKGPKGTQLHAGRNGLYYRKSLNENNESQENNGGLIGFLLSFFITATIITFHFFKKLDLKYKILIVAIITVYIIFVPKIETANVNTDVKICKNEYYCKTYKKSDEIKVARTSKDIYTVYNNTNNEIGKIEANKVVFPEQK